MGEGSNRASNGMGNRELEARLEALEKELDSSGRTGAELQMLRDAVADLAADTLDLRNQMEKIVSSCERVLAGGGGGFDASAVRRNSLKRSASTLRRVTGRAVRGTIGAARRFVGGREQGREPLADLDLRFASEPVRQTPGIAVVIRVGTDPGATDVPEEIRAQSVTDLEVVLWNEETARATRFSDGGEPQNFDAPDRKSLAAELSAGYVADLVSPLPRLHPTVFEVCRWTLASEGLPLLVQSVGSAPGGEKTWSVRPLEDWIDSQESTGLVKVVGGRDWHPTGLSGSPFAGTGGGRGYLLPRGASGEITHEVAPLADTEPMTAETDGRPAVIVTTTLSGATVAAWLQRELGNAFRFVVMIVDSEESGGSAIRAITDLGAMVYPIAGFLEPQVHPWVVADVLRAAGAGVVLRIDTPVDLQVVSGDRPFVIDLPFHSDEVCGAADIVLALGGEIADRARNREIETVDLVAAPDLSGSEPNAEARAGLRAAYNVPEGAQLVLTYGDLTPDRRPEDAAAVARRLRRREDVFFLMIGQGPLAGTVSDMAAYFGLDRFVISPAGHSMIDLVGACDCVLSPAEEDSWPVAVAAGLALGRSIVATDIDGVRELVAAADGDRCTLCQPGDVDALAAAVADGLDNHRPRKATKKAWTAARGRTKRCLVAIREAIVRGTPDGSEKS